VKCLEAAFTGCKDMAEGFTARIDRDRSLKRDRRWFSFPVDPPSKRFNLLGLGYRCRGAGARAFAGHLRGKGLLSLTLKGAAKPMNSLRVAWAERVFRGLLELLQQRCVEPQRHLNRIRQQVFCSCSSHRQISVLSHGGTYDLWESKLAVTKKLAQRFQRDDFCLRKNASKPHIFG
jgi:hypothetical protein